MSSVERLPPDQRAVLALVLQRGRTYDEIANLLAIDRAAVRDRALAAMDALAPSEPKVAPERRALITDYLLGQLPDKVRDQTRERLASSPTERAWARVLASELAPMSRAPMPEIPSGASIPAAEPAPEFAEALAAAVAPPATPEPPSTPEPAGAPAAAEPIPPLGGRNVPRPVPAEHPSSRRGGGVLLAIAAVIVVVAVIVILLTNGSSSPKKTPTTHASSTKTTTTTTGTTTTGTTTASKSPHIVAEIALKPVNKGSKAAGVADVVTEGKLTGVIVAADHLTPNTAHNAYAVWLSNTGSGPSHLLGYVSPPVGKDGDLKTSGKLPANVASYKLILVTLETTTDTTTPGPIVLAGAL